MTDQTKCCHFSPPPPTAIKAFATASRPIDNIETCATRTATTKRERFAADEALSRLDFEFFLGPPAKPDSPAPPSPPPLDPLLTEKATIAELTACKRRRRPFPSDFELDPDTTDKARSHAISPPRYS